jgi:hypothetical protein
LTVNKFLKGDSDDVKIYASTRARMQDFCKKYRSHREYFEEPKKVTHKLVHELSLHESTIVEITGTGHPAEWNVTRVPGGWFYQDASISRTNVSEFFVPLSHV